MSDRVFLILGASSELGISLVKKLNSSYSDSTFVLHYNSRDEELRKINFENSNRALFIKADLSKEEEVQELIEAINEKELVPTHIVQLSASKMHYTKLKEFDRQRVTKDLNIQVYALADILKAFLPAMVKRKEHNKVVAVTSTVACGKPPKFLLEYNMVKSMLLSMIKQLASDNEGKLVNINAVSPSMIDTGFLSEIDKRIIEMAAQQSPEGRNATVEEIVPAIAFLLSEDSNYINGANLVISNGSVIL